MKHIHATLLLAAGLCLAVGCGSDQTPEDPGTVQAPEKLDVPAGQAKTVVLEIEGMT